MSDIEVAVVKKPASAKQIEARKKGLDAMKALREEKAKAKEEKAKLPAEPRIDAMPEPKPKKVRAKMPVLTQDDMEKWKASRVVPLTRKDLEEVLLSTAPKAVVAEKIVEKVVVEKVVEKPPKVLSGSALLNKVFFGIE